jgi:hypothetical protein
MWLRLLEKSKARTTQCGPSPNPMKKTYIYKTADRGVCSNGRKLKGQPLARLTFFFAAYGATPTKCCRNSQYYRSGEFFPSHV